MRIRFHSVLRVVLAAASLNACSATTDTGPPPVDILGPWRYSAVQLAPTESSILGTLTVSTQSGTAFDGSIDAVEVLPDRTSRRLLGPVHGHTLDATTLDFDVTIDDVARRHVAVIQADTASGNWLSGSATASAAGTFRMVRVR